MKTLVAKKGAFGEKYLLNEVRYGGKATLKTYASLAYTGRSIRVKIEAEGQEFYSPYKGDYKNEPVWNADTVEVFLSPYGSEEWYYEVDVAPTGAWYAGHIFNPDGRRGYAHGEDAEKDGILWNIAIKDGWWTTEIEIPFTFLIADEKDIARATQLPWRVNIYRIDNKNDEYLSVCPTNDEDINFHITKGFGKLIFE
ncbi:MAG: carbohydrate-binding family 9-like protein [Clostridia bacterium]|nr:carbohydrate-binding family 9-like protein [Clostridia bacterium]